MGQITKIRKQYHGANRDLIYDLVHCCDKMKIFHHQLWQLLVESGYEITAEMAAKAQFICATTPSKKQWFYKINNHVFMLAMPFFSYYGWYVRPALSLDKPYLIEREKRQPETACECCKGKGFMVSEVGAIDNCMVCNMAFFKVLFKGR